MAGSSMPVTWRLPEVDIPLNARVQEVVMVGVGSMDDMDFDALEAMQSMLERRKGGETGVKAVQLLEGDDVWAAGQAGRWSKELLTSALSRSDTPLGLTLLDGRNQDLVGDGALPQLVKTRHYCIEYSDGTKATLHVLEPSGLQHRHDWRDRDLSRRSSSCPAQTRLIPRRLTAVDQMYQTRTTPYPIQRVVVGPAGACLNSRHRLNQKVETPHLAASYQPPAECNIVAPDNSK
jgi:hypothetical protein